tara:strand:+ start:1618 stop:4650 length:3033 start_codon:yes stop_codon:yes gene_type:complete
MNFYSTLITLFLATSITSFSQSLISGNISSDNGESIVGATVFLKGSNIGSVVDFNGFYKLENIPKGSHEIVVSYIGYNTINKIIYCDGTNDIIFDTTITLDNKLLDQVVVVGYGTQRKKELSSSIVTINSEDFKEKSNNNLSSNLQGKAAGVQITNDNGVAGGQTTIRIRGTNTLSGGAEPLYVIDGVPILNNDISDSQNRFGYNTSPLTLINPNDIEEISILKDASATSIYGARGANGVILITTKSGKSGKMKINLNYKYGVSSETNRLKMLNGKQYLDLYKIAWTNDGNDIEDLVEINGIHIDSISNTDWIDEVLQIGRFNDANLTISGGSEKIKYFIGSSFKEESTFLKGNQFQRATIKTTLDYKPIKKLNIKSNISIGSIENIYSKTGAAGGLGRAQSDALPIYPIYNNDGSYFWWDNGGNQNLNPVAEINLLENINNSIRTIGNFNIKYNITDNLLFNNELSIDYISQKEKFFTPKEIIYVTDSLGDSLSFMDDRKIRYTTSNINSFISYNRKIKSNSKLSIVGGTSLQHSVEKYKYNRFSGPNINFESTKEDALYNEISIRGRGQEYAIISLYSRLNYSVNEKYFFQTSFRRDGSSRFGAENKFGEFGALSIAWILSEENYFKKISWLSFLKTRLSVGSSGNDNIGNFNQYSFYSPNQNYAGQNGIGPDNPSVPNLKWETVISSDIAIDFGFFEDRVTGTIEYYHTNSKDVLVSNSPLSPSSGFTSVTKNLGRVESSGLEFQITTNNLSKLSKLSWKTDFNISSYRNKVLDLGGVEEVSGTNFGENRAIVGQPVGVFYLAEFAGIDENTGNELIYDLEGNIVELNATNSVSERKVLGKPYPDFFGGLNNSFEYKNFGFDFFLIFNYGQMIYDDHGKRQLGNMGFGWNQDIRTLDHWLEVGDLTNVPFLSLEQNRDINSSRHLYESSYIRLRNVSFSYDFTKFTKDFKLSNCKLFISAQNLMVWTKYKGWDPEVNREGSGAITQGVSYLSPPQSKVYSIGINLNL